MSRKAYAGGLLTLLSLTIATPSDAQYYDPDYPHSAFIPYGRGGPQYRGDYYGTYRNPIPWYTAPAARSYRAQPYYGGEAWRAQRPESFRYPGRPMLPGCQYFQCNRDGGNFGWNW